MKKSDILLKVLVVILAGLMIYGVVLSISHKYDTVMPFAIEHYSITDDGEMQIYFNREIEKDEDISISVTIDNSGKKNVRAIIPIDKNTTNHVFNYVAIQNDTTNVTFDRMIQNHVAKSDTISGAVFEFANGNGSYTTIIDGKIWFLWKQIENFKPSGRDPIEEVNRYTFDTEMWARSRFQFSEGRFDELGKKQGKWKWYFSNGSVLAEATFKDDVVSDSLIMYKFNEKIED
jgi:antitoxin component YwqK of YwqJK toxin-antitoxin module